MYEKYKNSYKVTEKELVSLSVYNVGFQRCDSLYQWGPGIRDHYLIHYIISGKGFYKIGKRTYELQAGDSFLVYPNTEVVYYAAETDPWEYAWVGFTGSDASMILKATDFSPEKPIIRETPHGSDIHRQILHIYDARGNEFEHAVEMTALYDACHVFTRRLPYDGAKFRQQLCAERHRVYLFQLFLCNYCGGYRRLCRRQPQPPVPFF